MFHLPYLYPYNQFMGLPTSPYPFGFQFGFPFLIPESTNLTLKYIDKEYVAKKYESTKSEISHVFVQIVNELCNESKDDFVDNIVAYISTDAINLKALCTTRSGINDIECDEDTFLFTRQKLGKLHEKFHSTDFTTFKNKACGLKQYSIEWPLTITAAQKGGEYGKENSYINIEELFSQRPTQQLMCVMHGDKLKCSHSGAHMQCELCKRWMLNRELLRYVILKMLNQNNIIEMIDLLIENINLFPVAILNEQEFHQFHIAIEQFRQAKRNNQF